MKTKESDPNEILCQKMKEKLLTLCDYKYKFYKGNQIIYNEKMPTDEIYYLREGKAKIFNTDLQHKELITRFVSSGDFFGINDLFSGKSHKSSCKTIENTTICAIPKKDFITVVKTYSDVDFYLIQTIVKSANETKDIGILLNDKSEKKRLAHVLLCLCDKFHTDTIKILKKDLSNFSRIDKAKLKPYLSELRDRNLIHYNSERILIKNKNGLRKLEYSETEE